MQFTIQLNGSCSSPVWWFTSSQVHVVHQFSGSCSSLVQWFMKFTSSLVHAIHGSLVHWCMYGILTITSWLWHNVRTSLYLTWQVPVLSGHMQPWPKSMPCLFFSSHRGLFFVNVSLCFAITYPLFAAQYRHQDCVWPVGAQSLTSLERWFMKSSITPFVTHAVHVSSSMIFA